MVEFDPSEVEYMETSEFDDLQQKIYCDLNLNVTSTPEQFDYLQESVISSFVETTTTIEEYLQQEEASFPVLVDLTKVDPVTLTTDAASSIDLEGSFLPDKCPVPPPLTVTLVKPLTLIGPGSHHDPDTTSILQELYRDDPSLTPEAGVKPGSDVTTCGQTRPTFRLCQSPAAEATTLSGVPKLPLLEPHDSASKRDGQTPEFESLASPTDSLGTGFTFASDEAPSGASTVSVPADREADIDRKASYIREVIEKRNNKPDDMSSKLKVHEVILVILLNSTHGDRTKDLQRILTFCDENGRETTGPDCRHFKTLDTETMGLLWQRIKGNKKGNYDTFARAMRVRRERSEGFFDYLESGKGKKKRIYRFGDRSMEEMSRFKRTLKQVSRPQTCSY